MCVLSLSTVSAVNCVSLVDSLSQAKQYSYHLRPSSAGSQSSQNRTKNWDHKMDTNMFGLFLQELNLSERHRDDMHLNSFDAYLNYCMRYSETPGPYMSLHMKSAVSPWLLQRLEVKTTNTTNILDNLSFCQQQVIYLS